MNKKFSTLLAGAMLATSVGAMAANPAAGDYKKLPAGTAVINATPTTHIASGDMVRLKDATSGTPKELDLFYGTSKVVTDSLIWGGTARVADKASKAYVDSLLFTVTHTMVAKNYAVTGAIIENTFTFASRSVKFAFAKPAVGKAGNAILSKTGAINEWILPLVYTTTPATKSGYAPYAVASRVSATDATPDSVYVLAQKTGAQVQIVKVKYLAKLNAEIEDAANLNVKYDAVTGKGELLADGTGATHTLITFSGYKVDPTVTAQLFAADIEDATGYATPSFKFSEAVSDGQENFLASYNWNIVKSVASATPDNGKLYLQAVGAKKSVELADGSKIERDLYLTVDTAFYDNANAKNFKFKLDTLPSVGDAAKWKLNPATFQFTISAAFGKDSITVKTVNTPVVTDGIFSNGGAKITTTAEALPIIIKDFSGKKVFTTQHAGDATATPLITPSEFPTKELADDETEQFTGKDVYVIYNMNKVDANGKPNEDYGKAYIIDNMNSRTAQLYSDKFDKSLPSHQWVVLKKNNVYTFKNRETAQVASTSLVDGKLDLVDVQLIKDSEIEGQLTFGARKDTIKLEKITTLSPFDGYKHITKEDQMNEKYTLRFVGPLLGDETFVQQGEDSVMTVAIANKDSKAELRFLQIEPADTMVLGDKDNFKLTAVPYAVKMGRYFLTFDAKKKVYRFTNKQVGEAYGEAEETMHKFMITKLVGGNIALTPIKTTGTIAHTQADLDGNKLAIDSETGYGVRVVISSDLRHTFDMQPADKPIFAMVADSALTSIKIKSVENLGWSVAKGQDDFIYEGVPSALKAGGAEYDKAAFDFKLDTAYVNRPGNTMPLYYITYGAARHDSTFVPHNHDVPNHVCPGYAVNDTISGKFLFMMTDSINGSNSRENNLKYGYTYNNDTRVARLQFINAKHVKDTLIANIGRPAPLVMDTMKAGAIAAGTTVEKQQAAWLAGNSNEALFAFRINLDNKEEYAIYNPATGLYITYKNGFLVATSDAAFYTLKDDEGFNVGNETIEGSASSVSVIAKDGAVQIAGAQGKKVVISNILGQIIANTVIASDNATIAAPKGIVVVAVEGEEAVKAIVK